MERVAELIPSFDPAWEMAHRERAWGFLYDPRVILFAWRRFFTVPRRADVRILDIGCGVGAQSFELARLGYSVLAVDASPSAIARAREKAPAQLLGKVDFIVGDVAQMYLEPDTFDLVTDASCLECLSLRDADKVIETIVRGLKRDGALFSITKADGWIQTTHQVGGGSRTISLHGIDALYGRYFSAVKAKEDIYTDCFHQTVREWVIECTRPKPIR